MSVENPQSVTEWHMYVSTLSGAALWSKALAANTWAFVQGLQAEGLSASEITSIFRSFANRLVEDGQPLPSKADGTYLDYGLLVEPGLPLGE